MADIIELRGFGPFFVAPGIRKGGTAGRFRGIPLIKKRLQDPLELFVSTGITPVVLYHYLQKTYICIMSAKNKMTDRGVCPPDRKSLVPVARVSKLFGTGGQVAVGLYDTFPAGWSTEQPLFAIVDGLVVPLYAEKSERRGRTGAYMAFADIDTPQRAAEFVGTELYFPAVTAVGEEDGDEVYFEDMVGFAAKFSGHKLTGTVVGFVDSEHNPLFTLSVDGREVFVPAADDLIEKFSVKKREVTFDLPEGLLELYL